MMNVRIICVGRMKEKYWTLACEEYAKRLSGFCRFSVVEVDEEKTADSPSPAQIKNTIEKEGRRILAAVPKGSYIAAMCVEGRQRTSEELSKELQKLAVDGQGSISFIIGGSWGLSDEVKRAADTRLSMSVMTFPHQLARVMLCEQIYRAFQISSGGKYHK